VGTAKISGRVVVAETGTPIRRANVRLTSRDARIERDASTDNEGRFEIPSLPAGRYRLFVSKPGYVSLEYGQGRAFEGGRPLDVAEGQALDKIDFSLPRGSAITGRITDEFGDPVTDVQVQAMRYQFENGARQLVNAGRMSVTDDLGQFRIFGLMPGDYIVRASLNSRNTSSNPAPSVETADSRLGYPGTYYPGVADVTQAQAVTLGLAQELNSVAFPLVPARLSRISGTVMNSEGRPLTAAMVVLRAVGLGGTSARVNFGGGNQVRPDGTFRLMNVPPGDYMLDVQQRPQNIQNLQNLDLSQLEFASIPISVSADIDNLAVITTPGVTVLGRVVFQGQEAQKPSARGIQITATAPSGMAPIMAFAGRALGVGRVNNDGTFQLRGLTGPQAIRASGLPAGWTVKSILLDGTDVTDAPFDFKPGMSFDDAIVTLTNRITELSGGVRDSRGQPVADYVLVVFPDDAKLWGAQSRHVTTARPDQNGNFNVKGLPPARYLAAILPALESGMQNDVSVLAQLRSRAESFSLAEGQTLNLNLEMPPQ
jgi:protocatechuate 3,4-dioxygenase beta subunit